MALPKYLFWWEWVKKMIWDPFWWVILLFIILWIPFLRVWWWVFFPIMLASQLKTIYLWWLNWDFYIPARKWVVLELIPPRENLVPVKAMEDMFSSIWPIADIANFREIWCDGGLDNGPEWCSWEIVSIEGTRHFYLIVGRHHRRAVEAALVREVLRRSEQHGGVAVVAARVHLAGDGAGVGQAGVLVDGQGVHVGAQAEAALAVAQLELPDHPGAAQAAMHGVAPFGQPFGHQIAGGEFFKAEFGMRVDAAAQLDHFSRYARGEDRVGHGVPS